MTTVLVRAVWSMVECHYGAAAKWDGDGFRLYRHSSRISRQTRTQPFKRSDYEECQRIVVCSLRRTIRNDRNAALNGQGWGQPVPRLCPIREDQAVRTRPSCKNNVVVQSCDRRTPFRTTRRSADFPVCRIAGIPACGG